MLQRGFQEPAHVLEPLGCYSITDERGIAEIELLRVTGLGPPSPSVPFHRVFSSSPRPLWKLIFADIS